jgi:phage tail-like protein
MADRLYDLLPAVYRTRDAKRDQPLRALLAVFEQQLDAVRSDIDTTWDNWFIETCEEWLVPYIGELLGIHGIRSINATGFSQRAFVANSIAYRRRKGTAAVVEELAHDLSGYAARAVEFFKHTLITAHMQHLREPGALPALGGTVDVRSAGRRERLDTAFDAQAHRADVRHIASRRGRYNLPHLGIFLWRIESFEVSRGTAAPTSGAPGWYRFHPLGLDAPLFNLPRTEKDITALAGEENVPHPLSRRDLFDELAGKRLTQYLGGDPAIVVRTERAGVLSEPWPLRICNLADVGGGLPVRRPPAGTVSVDPELGRLVFNPADVPPSAPGPLEVLVDYAYGFSGQVGAGPFDRSASHTAQLEKQEITFVRGVTRDPAAAGPNVVATLEEAVRDWNAYVTALPREAQAIATGALALLDSRTHAAPATAVEIPAGARLHLLGASISRGADGQVSLLANRLRPVVGGGLTVRGSEAAGSRTRRGGLFVNGLVVAGPIVVASGDLETLDLAHTTLQPGGAPSVDVRTAAGLSNAALALRLYRCLSGGIAAAGPIASATIEDSLVASPTAALALAGAAVDVCGSTMLGSTRARTLAAANTIFDGGIDVEQHQEGCLRFCYARNGERTPRRYRCQPDRALEGTDPSARARILARVRPRFTSRAPADPAYGQLAGSAELRTGAEDEAEMGVFHHLMHALREANLQAALAQYLRFGLEAGILLES